MKQFASIQKIDTGILYALELTSSVSVLLLAFGLIASMVNVLTKGTLLTNNSFMQELYAWTQCIGIDASIPGSIMRTLYYYRQREWGRAGVYILLSVLLLFTACLVSNIESIQQTLNITLSSAYTHVFIPIEGLIWIRSITVVLLVVVHAIRHVQADTPPILRPQVAVGQPEQQTRSEEVTVQEIASEQKALPAPMLQKLKAEENKRKVQAYLTDHPQAKAQELVIALSLSLPTVRKYMKEVRG
jgi:hypothetical protein